MSVESLAAVLHHSRAKGTAKLVLVGIANHDGDGGAFPSVRTLARYANVDVRNVQKSLDKLVSLGELVVHLQQGGHVHTPDHERTNRYDVLVSCPPWCDRTTQHRDTRESRQPNLRGVPVTPRRQRHPHPPAPASPPPVTPASPKPSSQPDPTAVGTQLQPARVDEWCTTCSKELTDHAAANAKVPADERHEFTARASRASG